jgi:AraC-like DNA-binding protein
MDLSLELRESIAQLAAPESPAAYFEGRGRRYSCALDNILLFARREASDLQRRSAESHLHRRFCLAVCLETAGSVSVDGVPFALQPGQAHLVFPQSYHHFLQLEKSSLLWLMITFETKEAERLAILRQRTLSLSQEDLDVISRMAARFNIGPGAGQGDALNADLSQLLCRWSENIGREETGAPLFPARKYAGLWQRLQVQLEELPPEDLRVGPLSGKLAISERHLRQKFHDQFGVSLGVYLKNYRIQRSIGLLISSDLSLAEIADRCGYHSSASFHRAFLSHTGVGPGQFRKRPVDHAAGVGESKGA